MIDRHSSKASTSSAAVHRMMHPFDRIRKKQNSNKAPGKPDVGWHKTAKQGVKHALKALKDPVWGVGGGGGGMAGGSRRVCTSCYVPHYSLCLESPIQPHVSFALRTTY